MREFLFLAIGFLAGVVLTRALDSRFRGNGKKGTEPINPEQVEQRKQNLEKILASLNAGDEIANDEVERLLGVSDATAERYLAELENQGKLRQIGRRGKYVIYRRT